MKSFIYQLLSKGLLLVVLLTVVAGYYYRTELFPKWFDEQGAKDVSPAAVVEPLGDAQVPAPEAAADVPEASVAGSDAMPVMPQQSVNAAQEPPVFRPIDEPQAEVQPAESQPESAPEVTAESAPVKPDLAPADLAAARRAYWNGDLEAAVAAYQAVVSSDPDNADAHGELGNVYFAQGLRTEAGQAYLQAAKLLLQQGHEQAAGRLMGVLVRLSPQHAAELARALSKAPSQGQ